jgi:uncharacterized protein YbaR (Trm112 family)
MSIKINNSALPASLLEKLVCPGCKGPFDYRSKEERLNCTACHLSFVITEGVPVLLMDEAEKL